MARCHRVEAESRICAAHTIRHVPDVMPLRHLPEAAWTWMTSREAISDACA